MQVPILVILAACLLVLAGARPQSAAALSIDDFRSAADQLGGAGSGSGAGPMSLEEFLRLSNERNDDPGLMRYFDGFRDALYQFNAVLRGVGVDVFCPDEDQPPIATSELRRRLEVDLAEKQATKPDFGEYNRTASLALVALEILAQLHPCKAEEEEQDEPPPG
jgi:hypothetical protein